MARFRKKPVEIDAVRFTYPPTDELLQFAGDSLRNIRKDRHPGAVAQADIVTVEETFGVPQERVITISEGDWISRGFTGQLFALTNSAVEAGYERVD